MALEGTYPIIIDGAVAGKLTVTVQGARTEFYAVCRKLEGVVRISVYGGGTEGCLGVLAPEGEKLGLRKVLSRAALKSFPQEIESVERSGGTAVPAAAVRTPAPMPEPKAAIPEQKPITENPIKNLRQMPETQKAPEALSWYSSPDGALVCFDGTSTLIALPLGDERIPPDIPGEQRTIEGKPYLVFVTKNGHIVH